MKVSFLVTYYNQEQYVRQSLDSILAIKMPCDWEILVGDDGSSDGTTEVVQEYVEKYPDNIFLYVMPRDRQRKYNTAKRLGANKLNLLEHATGDFYCNLDGDDYYCDTDFVEQAVGVLTENKNISGVGFGYKYVIDGVDGEHMTLPTDGYISKEDYLNRMYIPVGAFVLRRVADPQRIEAIKKMGFFDDNNVTINSLSYGDFYSIKKVIYSYRQSANSMYNSMDVIEQSAANVQGMDIEMNLMGSKYAQNLLWRYRFSIITLFVWKARLGEVMGQERLERYVQECSIIEGSLTYRIIKWQALSKTEKKAALELIFPLMIRNPGFLGRMLVNVSKYRVKRLLEQ